MDYITKDVFAGVSQDAYGNSGQILHRIKQCFSGSEKFSTNRRIFESLEKSLNDLSHQQIDARAKFHTQRHHLVEEVQSSQSRERIDEIHERMEWVEREFGKQLDKKRDLLGGYVIRVIAEIQKSVLSDQKILSAEQAAVTALSNLVVEYQKDLQWAKEVFPLLGGLKTQKSTIQEEKAWTGKMEKLLYALELGWRKQNLDTASNQLEEFLPKAETDRKGSGKLKRLYQILSKILENHNDVQSISSDARSLYDGLQRICDPVGEIQNMRELHALLKKISELASGETSKHGRHSSRRNRNSPPSQVTSLLSVPDLSKNVSQKPSDADSIRQILQEIKGIEPQFREQVDKKRRLLGGYVVKVISKIRESALSDQKDLSKEAEAVQALFSLMIG